MLGATAIEPLTHGFRMRHPSVRWRKILGSKRNKATSLRISLLGSKRKTQLFERRPSLYVRLRSVIYALMEGKEKNLVGATGIEPVTLSLEG